VRYRLVADVVRAAVRVLRDPPARVLPGAEVRRREEAEEAVLRLLRALAEADLDLPEADFERLPLVLDRLVDLLRVLDVAERRLLRLRPELDGMAVSSVCTFAMFQSALEDASIFRASRSMAVGSACD